MRVTNEELRSLKPLVVAVVGPTNEGKTSILRTLTSDPNFGLVNAYNGTTARAEIQKIFFKGIAELLQLVDTPGFQTSGEIYELLMEDPQVSAKMGAFNLDDIMRVAPQYEEDFRHDLRAWREVARADVVVFVVNVVENPKQTLLKHTLALLKNVGKPVIVAYNTPKTEPSSPLLASGSVVDYRAEWDETLRANNFFLVQEYDAHVRSFLNELELFEKLAALAREPLTQRVLRLEMRERRARELRRLERSREIVAELVVDVAAYREVKTNVGQNEWETELARVEETLEQNAVRREHRAQVELLETWGFNVGVLDREMLDVEDESAQRDRLFGSGAKSRAKVGGGVGATVGAVVGGAIDACVGGLSFGTGAVIGGFLGGLLGGGGALAYNAKYDPKEKVVSAKVRIEALETLVARGVDLTKKLQTRGKALDDAVQAVVGANPPKVEIPGLRAEIEDCRGRWEFSTMNDAKASAVDAYDWRRLPGVSRFTKELKKREDAVASIANMLKRAIPDVE